MTDINRIPLYRTIWRWHFYAGLFVIPFILMLSVTGGPICSSRSSTGGRKARGATCRPPSGSMPMRR
jgi:hypothetical protein